MTGFDRAAKVAVLAAFLILPWSLPAAAQTAEPTVIETSTECHSGACVPTTEVPVEGTVMRCLVYPSIPNNGYLVKCIDMFLGMVAVDPRQNGYSGPLVCTRIAVLDCPEVMQATVKDHPEPLSTKLKLDCTVFGNNFSDDDPWLECVQSAT